MFGGLISGLVDTEKIVRETLEKAMLRFSKEHQKPVIELFVMIRGINEKGECQYILYHAAPGQAPKALKQLALSEILESD